MDVWRDKPLGFLTFSGVSQCISKCVSLFLCSRAHSICICWLIWTNTVCAHVFVLAVMRSPSSVCEPDVAEHRYSLPPPPPPLSPPPIPWDRNKEARLHQAGLWSAPLYRVPNWQPSNPGCFHCNMCTEKVLRYIIWPLYFIYTTGSCSCPCRCPWKSYKWFPVH